MGNSRSLNTQQIFINLLGIQPTSTDHHSYFYPRISSYNKLLGQKINYP